MEDFYPTFEDDWKPSNIDHVGVLIILLWLGLYLCTIIVSTVGNAIVIWTIVARKMMKTSTYYMIAAIAMSDLLFVVFHALPQVYYMFVFHPFNSVLCKLDEFVIRTCMVITPLTLAVVAIVHCLLMAQRINQTPTKPTIRILVAILIFSILVSMPNVIFSSSAADNHQFQCGRNWPETNWLIDENVYDLTIIGLCYIFPAIGLIFIYGLVLSFHTKSNLDDSESQRQTIKMMMVASIVFIIGWFPTNYTMIDGIMNHDSFMSYDMLLLILWLSYCSAALKPIIYLAINRKFRCEMKKTFPFFPMCEVSEVNNGAGDDGVNINLR